MTDVQIVRDFFAAYVAGDRAAAEALAADDFVFTSPQDDHIDRSAFFEICFPTASRLESQDLLHVVSAGPDGVFVLYEYVLKTGERHRNCEFITVRDGQVVESQVYFGGRFDPVNVEIDGASKVPPYEQLRAQLATRIADSRLATGAKLPTVRRLAEELGLAANTVAKAYRELETAGLIETRGRAGTFVASGGDRRRNEVAHAATDYAQRAKRVGLPPDEALAIVAAALGRSGQ